MTKLPFITEESDIDFIYKMCTMSSYISKNSDYKKKAEETKISLSDQTQINAYASGKSPNYRIRVLAGLCNICSFIGTAVAQFKRDNDINRLSYACKWAGCKSNENSFNFTTDMIDEGISELKYEMTDPLFQESVSYFTGMLLSVVGHELGHICCSHTLRDSDNFKVSRNDERTADLFAQSIVATTPFAGYLVLASLFMEIVFTWLDPKQEESPATTHPYSRERVHNILTSHDEYLASIGITKDNIDVFLP